MVCWSVTRGGKHPRLAAGCVTHRRPVMQAEQLRGERVPRKKLPGFGATHRALGGAQIPSALGGKGEVSRAGNGWESSPKAWQRGRFCRGGGGVFSFFSPSPGKPRCLLPSGELHRSPQASGGHPQPLSSASSESSPRPRARGKGRAGWESTEGGHGATSPPCPVLGASPSGSLARPRSPAAGRCPSSCAHGMAAAARGSCWAPTATRGASPSLFSEPVCGRGRGEKKAGASAAARRAA